MVMLTVDEERSVTVHCYPYHMKAERRKKVPAECFVKKLSPILFRMVILTVTEHIFGRHCAKRATSVAIAGTGHVEYGGASIFNDDET